MAFTSWASSVVFDEPLGTRAFERDSIAAAGGNGIGRASHRFRTDIPCVVPRGNDQVSSEAPLGDQRKIAVPAVTVTSSLAVVLGLFAGLVWLTRKFGSRSMNHAAVPKEVLTSLGSTPIDSRTRITMLRCGNRILVVAQTATGLHPLSEITDPDEVRELTAACLGDSTQAFKSTLQSIEAEKTNSGFVDANAKTPSTEARSRGRLFATV